MVRLGLFLMVLGALLLLNGWVQIAKFGGAEERWGRGATQTGMRDDPRGPPAWMVEQRIWLKFGRLSRRFGPGLIVAGLLVTLLALLLA